MPNGIKPSDNDTTITSRNSSAHLHSAEGILSELPATEKHPVHTNAASMAIGATLNTTAEDGAPFTDVDLRATLTPTNIDHVHGLSPTFGDIINPHSHLTAGGAGDTFSDEQNSHNEGVSEIDPLDDRPLDDTGFLWGEISNIDGMQNVTLGEEVVKPTVIPTPPTPTPPGLCFTLGFLCAGVIAVSIFSGWWFGVEHHEL